MPSGRIDRLRIGPLPVVAGAGGFMIEQGWTEQHDRMLRSHARLVRVSDGSTSMGSDDARDALFHFFQDAYHLKDWIKHDSRVPREVQDKIGGAIRDSVALSISADLCHHTKHARLDPARKAHTGDHTTVFATQSVTTTLPTRRVHVAIGHDPCTPTVIEEVVPTPVRSVSSSEGCSATHAWQVVSTETTYDAMQLAGQILADWTAWLTEQGLLTP